MTAEVAVVLPGVVVLLAALLATGSVAVAQIRCVDAARAAARLAARREPPGTVAAAARVAGPRGSRLAVTIEGDQVVVAVRASLRLRFPGGPTIDVGARAVADLEPEAAATASSAAKAAVPPRVPGQRRGWMRTDRGSGSVLMLALVLVAATSAGAVATVGQALTMRHRASAAADLAALAGAQELQRNSGGGCARAVAVAARNGARVETCATRPDGVVSVTVSTVRAGPYGLQVLGSARAGPARFQPRTGS